MIDPAAEQQEQFAASGLARWLGTLPGAPTNCSTGPPCPLPILAPSRATNLAAIVVGVAAVQQEEGMAAHDTLHALGARVLLHDNQ